MADRYISSTGSNTSPYDTWAKAANTWTTAITGAVAADRFLADSAFVATETATAWTFPGTISSPSVVLSGVPDTTTGTGFLSLAPGAMIYSSANGVGLVVNGCFRMNGIVFRNTGTFASMSFATSGNQLMVFENCRFECNSGWNFGGSATSQYSYLEMVNSPVNWISGSPQRFTVAGQVLIVGDILHPSAAAPTIEMFWAGTTRTFVDMYGCDLSRFSATAAVWYCGNGGGNKITMRDCKMPTGFTGSPCTTVPLGNVIEMFGCGPGANPNLINVIDVGRRLTTDFATVRTNGASDGVTGYSWKWTGQFYTGQASHGKSIPLLVNAVAGVPVTLTVELAHSLASPLTNFDTWLEVEYLGANNSSMSTIVKTRINDITTPTALPSSSEAWSGTPTTKQKISTSVTPQQNGFIVVRVCGIQPNNTSFYIDPLVKVS